MSDAPVLPPLAPAAEVPARGLTLEQLMVERVSAYAVSDRPRELIDEGIDKLFKDVIGDLTRSYGDLGKAIKEAIAAAMPANVGDFFDLTRYNGLIAEQLRMRWEAAGVAGHVLEQANRSIDEVLSGDGLIKGEVSLRELLKSFMEENEERAREESWEGPEIRFEESDKYGPTLYVSFDPEPEDSYSGSSSLRHRSRRADYQLKHRMQIRLTEETRPAPYRGAPEIRVGHVYAATLDDKKVALDMMIHSKWEKQLAALYFGNAKLLIDCDEDDFSYGIHG
ncbi:hypothetical protein [Pseudomonas juntendi]|uniref:hypothetical protein n=1 Tax=Pseudomonas juntendi TaxID=2666183 RepID=UPI001F46AFDB|nr:hypothetical protein [Pseudomonas juntendi]MCO7058261.1 hypothetical protein [Pseudomonas juntendi]UJM15233.1 hypothetical protein L1P09_25810 [Pseudomonas juntendi]